jgi:hypothetical protein
LATCRGRAAGTQEMMSLADTGVAEALTSEAAFSASDDGGQREKWTEAARARDGLAGKSLGRWEARC